MNLYNLQIGKEAIIKRLNFKDYKTQSKMICFGFLKDVSFKIIGKNLFGGPIIVEIKNSLIAIGKDEAEKIYVKLL